MKRCAVFCFALLTATLIGCSQRSSYHIPAQHWGDITVELETRPEPPADGMNEFLIIASERHFHPVGDLVVSMKTRRNGAWRQAIQDGHIGVYRRALPLQDQHKELWVKLSRSRSDPPEQIELHFSLAPPP